ncbi:MAG TPA: hypothetical protein VH307_28375 [Streptosporangiaceae bacterium]|jgi:hypothetical protein|nr:hypothetical protein [Streptosporangiaceae bacterium]
MPMLACRCGYVHNLSPIPDDGFKVLPDWATDKLLYTLETKPEDWEIDELRRTALSRLYSCPNCEAIMWDRAGDGHYKRYVPSERLIRIYADLGDRDPLGGIWLRHGRTLADIEAQHLLVRPGVYVVVHNDRQEIYAHLEGALDDADNPIPEAWVARPLGSEEAAELRAYGA